MYRYRLVNMIQEFYKPIPIDDLQNKYKISDKGNVINIRTNKKLTFNLKGGYHYVSLKKDKDPRDKKYRLHILVAKAFIPNGDIKKTFVNHKNGNKLDNYAENLEWITPSENVKHAYNNGLIKPFERKIHKCDKEGNVIELFESLKEASEKTGIDNGGIVKVCKGIRQTAGGFKWKYVESFENENIKNIDINSMKDIGNFPNYKVTSEGKIYSIHYKKFLKHHINEDGYCTIQLQNNNKKKDFLIHRLVAMAFIENLENKMYVNHKNGIKTDNNVENLEWVTNSENMRHYHNFIKINS